MSSLEYKKSDNAATELNSLELPKTVLPELHDLITQYPDLDIKTIGNISHKQLLKLIKRYPIDTVNDITYIVTRYKSDLSTVKNLLKELGNTQDVTSVYETFRELIDHNNESAYSVIGRVSSNLRITNNKIVTLQVLVTFCKTFGADSLHVLTNNDKFIKKSNVQKLITIGENNYGICIEQALQELKTMSRGLTKDYDSDYDRQTEEERDQSCVDVRDYYLNEEDKLGYSFALLIKYSLSINPSKTSHGRVSSKPMTLLQ